MTSSNMNYYNRGSTPLASTSLVQQVTLGARCSENIAKHAWDRVWLRPRFLGSHFGTNEIRMEIGGHVDSDTDPS